MRAVVAALLVALVLLSGCETMRGFGKDVQRAGRWVEKKSH